MNMKSEEIKNIKLSWQTMTLALIPLCFIVDSIVSLEGSSYNDATVFMLVILNYTQPFYNRREQTPTIVTLMAFYVVSILGAFLILAASMGWVIFIVMILLFVYPATTVTTKYGDEVYEKTDEEIKKIEGVQLLATKTQRETNMHHVYDTVILLVVGVLFLLAREHLQTLY